jgi:hypothetical protein
MPRFLLPWWATPNGLQLDDMIVGQKFQVFLIANCVKLVHIETRYSHYCSGSAYTGDKSNTYCVTFSEGLHAAPYAYAGKFGSRLGGLRSATAMVMGDAGEAAAFRLMRIRLRRLTSGIRPVARAIVVPVSGVLLVRLTEWLGCAAEKILTPSFNTARAGDQRQASTIRLRGAM